MPSFHDGTAVIGATAHSAFARIRTHDYRIVYRVEESSGSVRDLAVKALHDGVPVAAAVFSDDGIYAHCQHIHVLSSHRRRGLATALYLFAERIFGRSLANFWAGRSVQTAAARALWGQEGRPFGRAGKQAREARRW